MQLFRSATVITRYDDFAAFAEGHALSGKDLVITNSFIYGPFISHLGLPCRFLMQEQYGSGEPSDEMIDSILRDVDLDSYDRIIAVGGGTVIDIAKLMAIGGIRTAVEAFERKIPIAKARRLVIVPTTCGTGSEVTNISIAEIKSRHTKMGLADDAIAADEAALIPELLKSLPFRFYACSAIDALIHAVESYVSPGATPYTEIFSREAIRIITDVFTGIAGNGEEYRTGRFGDMLIASNLAGIAFGNAGVGAVHALSYPLGGTYHVPHGEANYQFFIPVFRLYSRKRPGGRMAELEDLLRSCLKTDGDPFTALDSLLGKIMEKPSVRSYGMTDSDAAVFAESVVLTQQRLLKNNYTELTREEIEEIYNSLLDAGK